MRFKLIDGPRGPYLPLECVSDGWIAVCRADGRRKPATPEGWPIKTGDLITWFRTSTGRPIQGIVQALKRRGDHECIALGPFPSPPCLAIDYARLEGIMEARLGSKDNPESEPSKPTTMQV